ncbi:HPr family phosphocarrier protein [Halorubrum sp. RMP-47]|uniref:HPr family phosphocarrier protein n=1 Tax=Halorubrum miltondacostae TaxID=3076378 RepID=A0ABD5M746_9EURY
MERTVTVAPEAGLHARPASKLVQTANRFDADVSIGRDDGGDLVRADSMLSVSGLNVEHGESVRVSAEGPDAEAALDAVCDLLTSPIEESADDPGDGGTAGDAP